MSNCFHSVLSLKKSLVADWEENVFVLTSSAYRKTSVSGSYGYQYGVTFEFNSKVLSLCS